MKVYLYVFLLFFVLGGCIGSYIKQPLKKATFVWWPNLLHRINNVELYRYFQSKFKQYGYHLETQNIHPPQNSEIVIWGYPHGDLSDISPKQYLVGWLMESPLSLTQPLEKKQQQKFDLILTYRKDLVDNKKSFFVRIFTRIGNIKNEYWHESKSILVSQIASYASEYASDSSYNERQTAAKWFLQNAPLDFKFYGNGWQKIKANLSKKDQVMFDARYGGYVLDKLKAVSKSKFVLAYENAIQTDYVTEKIYDVLQAGSVPIYWGAPNIDQYVPKNCFINKNDFKSYEELYAFLKNMNDETYETYRQCAYHFIQQKQLKQTAIIDRVVHYIFKKKEKTLYDLWHQFWSDTLSFLHISEREYI